jgi:hypothetical protein
VVAYLEFVPGCIILESGTDSGSLTTSLARTVVPHGRVYTFDIPLRVPRPTSLPSTPPLALPNSSPRSPQLFLG